MKTQLFNLAKEITALAYQVEELEAQLQSRKELTDRQSKVITYAIGKLSMTFNEMLEAASIEETEALAGFEDVMPTPDEMQELSQQDSEQLTDNQKQYYYASSTNPAFNPSIDPENC